MERVRAVGKTARRRWLGVAAAGCLMLTSASRVEIPSPEMIRANDAARDATDDLLAMRFEKALAGFEAALAVREDPWDRYGRARSRYRNGDFAGAVEDFTALTKDRDFRVVALEWLARLRPAASGAGGAGGDSPVLREVSRITRAPVGAAAHLTTGELVFAPPAGGVVHLARPDGTTTPWAEGFEAIASLVPLEGGGVLVVDFGGDRLVRLDASGRRGASYPAKEDDPPLLGPYDAARLPNGDIVVSVSGPGEVVRLRPTDGTLRYVTTYRFTPPLARPRGILAAEDGGFWVAEAGRGRVVRADAEGRPIAFLGHPGLVAPTDLASEDGGIWIADAEARGRNGLFRYEPADSAAAVTIPVPYEGAVRAVAPDPHGTLYLASDQGLAGYRSDGVRLAWVEIVGASTRNYPDVELLAAIRGPRGEPLERLTRRNVRVLVSEADSIAWPFEVVPPPSRAQGTWRLVRVGLEGEKPPGYDAFLDRLARAWGDRPQEAGELPPSLAGLSAILEDLGSSPAPAAVLLIAGDVAAGDTAAGDTAAGDTATGVATTRADDVRRLARMARASGVAVFVLNFGKAGAETLRALAEGSGGAYADPYAPGELVALARRIEAYEGGLYRVTFRVPNPAAEIPRTLVPVSLEVRFRGLKGFDRSAYRVPLF